MGNGHELVPLGNRAGSAQLGPPSFPPTLEVEPTRRRSELDWERVVRILQKNWRIAFVFAVSTLVVVTVASLRMKDIYEPVARLEIEPPGSEVFSLKDLLNSQGNDQEYLLTQVQILQSDELALSVIRTLRLDRNPEIVGNKTLQEAADLLDQGEPSGTQLTPLENISLPAFKRRLTVTQVRNSRLAEVSFSSHDPRLAAQVTNTLVNLFIDRNYRTRYETTMQASEWLQGQLSDLRQKVQQSNKALVEYQRANNIVDVDDTHNTVTQKVAELNRQLTQAQADRIQLEAYVNMINAGAADSLSQIRNNQLLQALTQRCVDARAQLAQGLAIYGKNNSNVKKLQSQVDELELQLTAERQRVIAELKTGYEAARAREQLMAQALAEMKAIIDNMKGKMIQYTVLKNEARANADLYNVLLARLKEAGISAGLKSTNIRVVDQARVLDRPTGPHRLLNIAMGLVLGVLGGIALAFLRENLDNTIRTPDDVKDITGLPSLAMFPMIGLDNGGDGATELRGRAFKLLAHGLKRNAKEPALPSRKFFLERPRSAEAEAVRTLHTSIMLSRPGRPPRVILVASPSPGEGKTTVAVSLALVLAQRGKTCLVDGDLRRPVLARTFDLSPERGLSNLLTGSAPLDVVLQAVPNVENLMILPVGPLPPNPGELVASDPMRKVLQALREQFQYVVIDSPPFIPFADGRALSTFTDGVVLVGRFGMTTRQALVRANEILSGVHAPVLGVVLNGMDLASPDYHYYHYGYSYRHKDGYGYEEGDDEQNHEEDTL